MPSAVRFALIAAMAVILVAGAVFIRENPPGGDSRYPACTVHEATGLYCPGCGTTRAAHALLNFRPGEALRFNALTMILAPLAIGWVAVGAWRWARGKAAVADLIPRRWIWLALLAAAVVFTVLRNLPGEAFFRPSP